MNEESNFNNSENRIKVFNGILAFALTVVFGALCSNVLGFLALIPAAALFAFLMIALPNRYIYLAIPLSYGLGFALCHNPVSAISSFLFVLPAVAVKAAHDRKANLSVTVIAASVAMLVSFSAAVAVNFQVEYGSVVEGINQLKNSFSQTTDDFFKVISELYAQMGEEIPYTQESVELLKKYVYMLTPAMVIFYSEVAAYITEKLTVCAAKIFGARSLYGGEKRGITLGIPAALIYIIAYVVSTFDAGDSILFYSATTLEIAVLPFACIVGIKAFFGENGIFRKKGAAFTKICIIAVSVMALLSSPIMLLLMLALWGSVGTVTTAIIKRAMQNRE